MTKLKGKYFNARQWDWKKKVITNWGKKTESIKVNSTDPPPVTWDQDKKN
jgi:hypothetical protein